MSTKAWRVNHERTETEMLVRAEGASGRSAVPVSLRTEPLLDSSVDERQRKRRQAQRLRSARWFQQNKERLKAHNREALKAWRKANPEKYRAQSRRNYYKHREKIAAATARWRIVNRDKHLATLAAYRARNRARIRAAGRRNYLANRQRVYRNVKASFPRMVKRLTRLYLRRQLKKQGINNPTMEQIESCRLKIQLHRARPLLQLQAAAAALSNLSLTSAES